MMTEQEKREYIELKKEKLENEKLKKKYFGYLNTVLNHSSTKLFAISLATLAVTQMIPSAGFYTGLWQNLATTVVGVTAFMGAASAGASVVTHKISGYLDTKPEEPLLLEGKLEKEIKKERDIIEDEEQ